MGKQEFVQAVGFDLVAALKNQLNINESVITGALKRSITFRVEPDNIVISMLDYGEHVEFGTAPHVIMPKGKALKFEYGGKTVFTKRVNHPGSRPKPFIRPVLHRLLPKIIKKNRERYL